MYSEILVGQLSGTLVRQILCPITRDQGGKSNTGRIKPGQSEAVAWHKTRCWEGTQRGVSPLAPQKSALSLLTYRPLLLIPAHQLNGRLALIQVRFFWSWGPLLQKEIIFWFNRPSVALAGPMTCENINLLPSKAVNLERQAMISLPCWLSLCLHSDASMERGLGSAVGIPLKRSSVEGAFQDPSCDFSFARHTT